MLVGRVVQGAAGGIFPLAFGIIRDEFPRDRVAAGIGLMSALLGVGGGAGVVLAGPIVDNLSFHYLFWLPLIPIVIVTVATHFFVPESPVKVPGRVNWTGAALMSLGLIAVLVAVSETATWHWLSAKTIGSIVVGPRPARPLGAQRVAVGAAARRHADDADPRRLDDQHGLAAPGLRDVRLVHPPAAIRRDAGDAPATGSARPSPRRACSWFRRPSRC